MKNTLLAILLCTFPLSVLAQETMQKLMDDVSKLVNANGTSIDLNDQELVKKNLRQIVQLFRLNGYEVPANATLICDSGDNRLVNLDTQQTIHDFSNYNACTEALSNLKAGKLFCDFDDNSLRGLNGLTIHDFSNTENCRDAVESIYKVKKYCDYDDNTLRRADGVLLYDFSSKEECIKNLN